MNLSSDCDQAGEAPALGPGGLGPVDRIDDDIVAEGQLLGLIDSGHAAFQGAGKVAGRSALA